MTPERQTDHEEQVGHSQVQKTDVRHGVHPLVLDHADHQQIADEAEDKDKAVQRWHEHAGKFDHVTIVAEHRRLLRSIRIVIGIVKGCRAIYSLLEKNTVQLSYVSFI